MFATGQNTGADTNRNVIHRPLFGEIQLFLEDKSWQKIPEIESAKD
jgi:hypothetical protein